MKKIILAIALLLLPFLGLAQDDSAATDAQNNAQHELKLNALFFLLGAFELEYEYLINEESGAGISVFFPFDEAIDINYYISPYYRLYFGKKPAAGFFFEGFAMLNSTEDFIYNETSTPVVVDPFGFSSFEVENVTDFALGIGIGAKFLTKRGLALEISSGVGRNLFNGNRQDFEFVGKAGIKVAYRF